MDAAAAAVFSELGGVFSLKEEERRALKVFLSGKVCFKVPPALFWQEFG